MVAMTHILLIYDITDDRVRNKVACYCQDYGLDRMQYSAFYGRLNRNLQEELMLKLQHTLGKSVGTIQLIPIGADDWERRMEVGHHVS
jgi:CRISPR-associated protein Cas2